MAYSILTTLDAGATASSSTITVTGTLTVGARIVLMVAGANNTDLTSTVSDGTSNSYTKVSNSAINNPFSSGMFFVLWECQNVVTGGSQTITVTYSSAVTQRGIMGMVIGGLSNTAAAVISKANVSPPGNGTDVISSGNATPVAGPAAVIGFGIETSAQFTSLTAGTGFTQRAFPNFSAINGGMLGRGEDKRVTSPLPVAAKFSTATGGTDDFNAYAYTVPEAGFPAAVVYQENFVSTSSSAPSLGLVFLQNEVAGSSNHVVVQALCASAITITVTDSAGNTYTQVGTTLNDSPGAGHYFAHFYCNQAIAGANTVTASFSPNALNSALWIREIGYTNGFDVQASAVANGSPPTTLSTGNATPSTQPGLISGVASMINATTQTLSAGSGFNNDSSAAGWMTESQRYTSTTAKAATWGLGGSGGSINVMTVAAFFRENLAPLGSQTAAFAVGQPSATVKCTAPAQTITSSGGTVTTTITTSLGSLTSTWNEGSIPFGPQLGSQTATFSEGTITATIGGNPTLALSGQTAQFFEGTPTLNVSYLLDQNTIIIVGQTATFALGAMSLSVQPAITAQTVTSTEGTITSSISTGASATLGSLTATFTEGTLSVALGNNVTNQLLGQSATFSEGVMALTVGPALTAQTATYTVGSITFSSTGDFTVALTAQSAHFIEGIIAPMVPQGTGPPLFIPPQLGKPVTTRTFSWADMAQRAWGPEFRAPDHRIYRFSGGNYKDSTDMGTTGIYRKN